MNKECYVDKAKFIYTKNDFNFDEILEQMKFANEVTIVTYNISEKDSTLKDYINSVPENCKIKVITNIPGRWERYFKDDYREAAKKKINIYLKKLSSENIGNKSKVFFNFNNHGKIIMTDSIIYVGSANYSNESKNNIEFGFISKDKNFISFIKSEVLPDIEISSIPYFEYNYLNLKLEFNMILDDLKNLYEKFFGETYVANQNSEVTNWYINNEDILVIENIEIINNILKKVNSITNDVYNAIDDITNSDNNDLENFEKYSDELYDISQTIIDCLFSNEVYDLAKFNLQEEIEIKLQSKYGMEAYDEKLDYYINISYNEASEKLNNLFIDAEETINIVNIKFKEYLELLNQAVYSFNEYDIKKINPKIDNT